MKPPATAARCRPAEASVFVAGTADPLIDLDDGVAAAAICADAGRRSHADRAAARGAGAYLAGMFVIPADRDTEHRRLASTPATSAWRW